MIKVEHSSFGAN